MSDIDHGRACALCSGTYTKPCDGKDATCPNRLYLEAKKLKEDSK